jgi:type IX secretion system PorP/SprF family membrane protein
MRIWLKILVAVCLLGSVNGTWAQENDYTQYYTNMPAINAGFTGMEDYSDLKVGVREGWNGFGIKNSNSFLSSYGTLNSANRSGRKNNSLRTSNPKFFEKVQRDKKFRRRHGLGGMITSRTVDSYKAINASMNYAYHLPLLNKLNISLGARVGYTNQRLDFSGLIVRDDVNDIFYQSLIQSNQGSQNTLLADFGTVVYSNKFFFGLSSSNLVARKLNGDQLFNLSEGARYRMQTGTTFSVSPELELSPGLIATYQDRFDLQWAANVRLRYKEFIYLGTAYDSNSKVSILFGVTTTGINFNYAYDVYTSGLSNFNVNAHEIVLGITLFNKFKLSPRFW